MMKKKKKEMKTTVRSAPDGSDKHNKSDAHPLLLRPICGLWSDEGRRRQLVKFIPCMAR